MRGLGQGVRGMRLGPAGIAMAGTGVVATAAFASLTSSYGGGGMDLPRRRPPSSRDFGHPNRRLTDIILVVNGLVFGLDWLLRNELMLLGAKVNSAIAQGQVGLLPPPALPLRRVKALSNARLFAPPPFHLRKVWRFFTPALLHADLLHILFNSMSLNNIGPEVESLTGKGRFTLVSRVPGPPLPPVLSVRQQTPCLQP